MHPSYMLRGPWVADSAKQTEPNTWSEHIPGTTSKDSGFCVQPALSWHLKVRQQDLVLEGSQFLESADMILYDKAKQNVSNVLYFICVISDWTFSVVCSYNGLKIMPVFLPTFRSWQGKGGSAQKHNK